MSKNATLEERASAKVPSLAKVAGYHLNNPNHRPNYIPTLPEVIDSIRDYSARMRQKAEEHKNSRKY
jgi:hypothetical protein